MAASRHSRPSYVRIESKVHEIWRTDATRFHQNMFDCFSSGPSKTGYHVVSNGENLKEKIKIAIFGFDCNRELTEEEKKMITDLSKKVVKFSPEVYSKNRKSVLAIVYVHVLLNNDNAESENHVLFRVPKFVEENKDKEKEEKVSFTVETVEIEYVSGKKTVYDLKNCDSAYFIDTTLRVYTSWEDFKKKNLLPKGRMCLPQDGVYKAGEDGKVLVETLDTPARDEGALELLDASTSVLGKIGAGICLASNVTPVTAVVCWGALGIVTASSLYTCGRSAGKLVDRAIYDQELSFLNKEARHLWIDSAVSGAVTVVGCKMLASGFVALRANGFKMSSSEVAAVWSTNTSIIIASSAAGGLQVILTKFIDDILLNDWTDMPSIKNLFCLFLNIFSPVEQIKKTLEDILTITKHVFNVASSVGHYLLWSFDKLTTTIGKSAEYLLDIATITGKFLFKVSVGLLDKRFSGMHDSIKGLLSGDISLVAFAPKMIKHSEDIWSWFAESFENANQEYRKLCNEKNNAKHIIRTVGLDNEENQRKMFVELDDVIKVCGVNGEDRNYIESLIKLVDVFQSRLGADSSCNEFLYSVRVVCAFVKECCNEKMDEYERKYKFEKYLFDDDFDEDKFNEQFGLEKNIDPATHFFAQVVASLQTEDELSKMFKMYDETAAKNANKAIPSIQTEGIKQYNLFINPSEVTDVSQDGMWQQLFRAQTGIAINEGNVHMDREDVNNTKIISIRPKTTNLNFVFACFIIREDTPRLKGTLSVCTSVKEE